MTDWKDEKTGGIIRVGYEVNKQRTSESSSSFDRFSFRNDLLKAFEKEKKDLEGIERYSDTYKIAFLEALRVAEVIVDEVSISYEIKKRSTT